MNNCDDNCNWCLNGMIRKNFYEERMGNKRRSIHLLPDYWILSRLNMAQYFNV